MDLHQKNAQTSRLLLVAVQTHPLKHLGRGKWASTIPTTVLAIQQLRAITALTATNVEVDCELHRIRSPRVRRKGGFIWRAGLFILFWRVQGTKKNRRGSEGSARLPQNQPLVTVGQAEAWSIIMEPRSTKPGRQWPQAWQEVGSTTATPSEPGNSHRRWRRGTGAADGQDGAQLRWCAVG